MPNSGSSSDNHPAAALRHYHDAVVLQSASCRENALCHYAFSVECAQKALLCWSTGKSMEDIENCKSFSQEMERILMCMIIDGLIQV